MAAEQPETDAFLASIQKKIDALVALADSYRAALAVGALGQSGEDYASFTVQGSFARGTNANAQATYDLPTGIFLNTSMPNAIKLFLETTKRKQTPKEVAAALKDGGFESTSKNFEKIVTTTMHRMKGDGDLLQFKDGWGLASLYPESLRVRIAKDAKESKPSKGGKKVRRSPQRKGSVAKAPAKADALPAGPKPVALLA